MIEGRYRTDNMAEATVLAIAGFAYMAVKITERKVVWVFTPSPGKEEDMDDVIDAYSEFTHRVEPRQFIARYNEMRDELFRALRQQSVSPLI